MTKLLGTLDKSPLGLDDLDAIGIQHAPPLRGAKLELAVHAEGGVLPATQIDGEELPAGDRYTIEVAPRALRLIVPREQVASGADDELHT